MNHWYRVLTACFCVVGTATLLSQSPTRKHATDGYPTVESNPPSVNSDKDRLERNKRFEYAANLAPIYDAHEDRRVLISHDPYGSLPPIPKDFADVTLRGRIDNAKAYLSTSRNYRLLQNSP